MNNSFVRSVASIFGFMSDINHRKAHLWAQFHHLQNRSELSLGRTYPKSLNPKHFKFQLQSGRDVPRIPDSTDPSKPCLVGSKVRVQILFQDLVYLMASSPLSFTNALTDQAMNSEPPLSDALSGIP